MGTALRRVHNRHHTLCASPPVLGRQQLCRHLRRTRLRCTVWLHRRGSGQVSGPLPGRTGTPRAVSPRAEHAGRVAGTVQRLPLHPLPWYAQRLQPLYPNPRLGAHIRKRSSPRLGSQRPLALSLERVGPPGSHRTAGRGHSVRPCPRQTSECRCHLRVSQT